MYIQDAKFNVEKEVELKGWLYNSRSSGKLIFLLVRDGTGIIQCVVSKNEIGDEVFEKARKVTQESSLTVNGVLHEEKRAPGGYELIVKDLNILQIAEDYPITPKEHGVAF